MAIDVYNKNVTIIKSIIDINMDSLTKLINLSISTSTFLECLGTADMIHILKKSK